MRGRYAVVVCCAAAVFVVVLLVVLSLWRRAPGPEDYMVAGSAATLAALLVLFAGVAADVPNVFGRTRRRGSGGG